MTSTMTVTEKYKYQLHFHCPSCGHAWVTGHHVVTLEEPCPRWFCPDEPIANYSYERSEKPAAEKPAAEKKPAKRAIRSAA
jgi:hypothetical protein